MTEDDKALVERLRERITFGHKPDGSYLSKVRNVDGDQAADHIEAQAAEIERLREALAFYAAQCDAPVEGRGDCGMKGNLCCLTAREALGESHD